MKRIPRDPLRFEVFDLFAIHAQQQRVTIHTPKAADQFLGRVRESVERALGSDTLIYGHHTQALFEALTVSLGGVKLLKREDAGELYADEDELEIPDYHIVLPDGHRLLVEVKNLHQTEPFKNPLILPERYVRGIRKYAELMNAPLRFAVFWVRWNAWTLVTPDVFRPTARGYELTFADAMINNDMGLLGDKAIGTVFPLKMRFVADADKPRTVGPDGVVIFTISDIKLFSKDNEITDEVERNIALYLTLYGKWEPVGPAAAKIVDGEFQYAEETFMPLDDDGQGFEIIGWLSSMYSAFYRQATASEGRIGQIRLEAVPGQLGQLVPEGYHGESLPLWIFILTPAHPLPAGRT